MPFKIIRNDITKVKADAIVNPANPLPIYASGTDAAIYKAAGAEILLAERKKIGKLGRGQTAVTQAFALPAKYIIHTVGPAWIDGTHGELEILTSCYNNTLAKAAELKCKSIAFPLIATGVYGFPKDKALQIAISEISKFLLSNEMNVFLVVFDRHSFELSGKLFLDIDAFIDENYVSRQRKKENQNGLYKSRVEMIDQCWNRCQQEKSVHEEHDKYILTAESIYMAPERKHPPVMPISARHAPDMSLDDVLDNAEETFQQRLLYLIDESGLSDVDVYKRANLDRKLFSKIRCNKNYKPRKKTALALAIALKLNLEETTDLLQRAELALSPSSKSDLIVEYFIRRQEYDIFNINMALFQHHQPILGE